MKKSAGDDLRGGKREVDRRKQRSPEISEESFRSEAAASGYYLTEVAGVFTKKTKQRNWCRRLPEKDWC
ncbi:hypothetical protein U1Q18_003666 [Sarracenia purpurea var. burkii]